MLHDGPDAWVSLKRLKGASGYARNEVEKRQIRYAFKVRFLVLLEP